MSIKTFKDLKNFLDTHNEQSIIPWLSIPWVGKDKLESLLRIFTYLNLFPQFENYIPCHGNFNENTLIKQTSVLQAFNLNGKDINLKDKGDSSDLSFISKTDNRHLLLTTSKNLSNMTINKLDIEKIITTFTEYEGYTMSLCICIKSKKELFSMLNRTEGSNKSLKDFINKKDTIIIDYKDIDRAYKLYKNTCANINITDLDCKKPILSFKPHQIMTTEKTLKAKETETEILWGQIQRSGKSYMLVNTIIVDSKNKDKCNYLSITTAPNETMLSQSITCNCFQLRDFNIVIINGENKKPILSDKNIIICSKQFLQDKIDENKHISWLKNMEFDIRFIDESHHGGTTELAKKVLKYYGNNVFTVYITATYFKPVTDFNIANENRIIWDLEDISMMKNLTVENRNILVAKHGDEFINCIENIDHQDIIQYYEDYPEIHILTDNLVPIIEQRCIDETVHNDYGWSTNACLLLNDDKTKFQNENETCKLIWKVFGRKSQLGIPYDDYPEETVFMDRIKRICIQKKSRHIDNMDQPMIIMAFLPPKHINETSNVLIALIKDRHLLDDYIITNINGKISKNDPMKRIQNAHRQAINKGKKGVLVLSGKQCYLGVTIPSCDIVLLLHNSKSYDSNQQMMFRSMSSGHNKKCGFVVDLDIHRCIYMMTTNATQIKPGHPKKSIKYLLEEKIINFNVDHWLPSFCHDITTIDIITDNIYNIYTSDLSETVKNHIAFIKNNKIFVDEEDHYIFENLINSNSKKKTKKIVISKSKTKIKKGIKSSRCVNEDEDEEDNIISKDNRINFTEFIAIITPLLCFLTINHSETDFKEMLTIVYNDEYLNSILQSQLKTWWKNNIENFIKQIMLSYNKYMSNDQDIRNFIRIIKELIKNSSNQPEELSKLVDKYLIPQEIEKIEHAEVSTPYILREEMIDKIPDDTWCKKMKSGRYKYATVFEPCAGKGGFLLTIINKLMTKMECSMPDKDKRYKYIVEKCLYFADINPTNIFICKLLIDPNNKYNLNYYEGNTLEMDINEIWNINGFDIIIGNPPYNSSGNLNSGNTIWQQFVEKSLNNWIKPNGYLCFVHPPGWRKPCDDKSQMKGFYDLMCKQNNMLYLSMHDINDGKKTFSCGTKYDWYVIKNTVDYVTTEVLDYNGDIYDVETQLWDYLPNYNFEYFDEILATDEDTKLSVIMNSTYHATRDHVQDEETEEFCYPLVHSTPISGIRYKYTNDNTKGMIGKKHFGIPKIIFGEAGINYVIEDVNGEYGMTQGAIAIVPKNISDFPAIKQVLLSEDFSKTLKACSWSNFRIDAKLFISMKEDFWKCY